MEKLFLRIIKYISGLFIMVIERRNGFESFDILY